MESLTNDADGRDQAAASASRSAPPVTSASTPGVVRLACAAMGTRFELALVDAGGSADLRSAGEAAMAEIVDLHDRLSLFRSDSLVSHLNREAAARPVRVDRDTFELLEAAAAVHRASAGLFDVTVAPVMHAFGLHDRPGDRPDAADAASVVDAGAIELDAEACTVRFRRAGVMLDLGGIAKGHALDVASSVLREEGVTAALLHGGTSSVVAIGAPPGRATWTVGMRHATGMLRLEMRDVALGVSTPDGRTAGPHGHVVDPRSGRPGAGVATAAVLAPSARDADAWTKPILLEGGRPVGMPVDLTAIIVHDETVTVSGPDRRCVSTPEQTVRGGEAQSAVAGDFLNTTDPVTPHSIASAS